MKHLEEVIINYDKKLTKAEQEIERLNNIIKEAKEYIESRARKAGVELMPREIELLEILNKGDD